MLIKKCVGVLYFTNNCSRLSTGRNFIFVVMFLSYTFYHTHLSREMGLSENTSQYGVCKTLKLLNIHFHSPAAKKGFKGRMTSLPSFTRLQGQFPHWSAILWERRMSNIRAPSFSFSICLRNDCPNCLSTFEKMERLKIINCDVAWRNTAIKPRHFAWL